MRIVGLIMWLAVMAAGIGQKAIDPAIDMSAAKEWCDSMPLALIEGIWEYPSDGVRVLIMRREGSSVYDMRIIEGADGILEPGETLGVLHPTSSPHKFQLKMRVNPSSKVKKLKKWEECAAELTASGNAIDVEMPHTKFSFNPMGFLHGFWRIVRMHHSDPSKDLPHGLVRIYPSYDGNNSSFANPRYL